MAERSQSFSELPASRVVHQPLARASVTFLGRQDVRVAPVLASLKYGPADNRIGGIGSATGKQFVERLLVTVSVQRNSLEEQLRIFSLDAILLDSDQAEHLVCAGNQWHSQSRANDEHWRPSLAADPLSELVGAERYNVFGRGWHYESPAQSPVVPCLRGWQMLDPDFPDER